MSEIERFIIEYIEDNSTDSGVVVTRDTNFVDNSLLDSFAILNLIMTLESQYGVKFEPRELADPELRTVGKLAEVTSQKMA